MRVLIVVDNLRDWPVEIPGTEVVATRDYVANPDYSRLRNVKVFNFCRSLRYQSAGYYVSLLGAARGHRPMPDVMTIQDLKSRSVIKLSTTDIEGVIQKSLKPLASNEFTISIYFGRNLARRYERLSRQLFNLFPVPLMRGRFSRKGGEWQLTSLKPMALGDVPDGHRDFLQQAARDYFARRRRPAPRREWRYDMAILVNPEEPQPPSDERALKRFARAARHRGFAVEFITRDDYGTLGEFDALFIRETTLVNHHTYRFARRAAVDGLVVIDDPESILRCTNKVFLAELLQRHRITAPKTMIVHRDNQQDVVKTLGLPCVLKQPDGSFSRGVSKADTEAELKTELTRFLDKSDLVLAQAFVPTEFDWRIGIIDRKPLYACRYFMAADHWQIYHHHADARDPDGFDAGEAETLAVEDAPRIVVETALKAANAIGDGFYGVDLKEFDGKCQVIEVNDNPSIDRDYEDVVLGDDLYGRIMDVFVERVRRKRGES